MRKSAHCCSQVRRFAPETDSGGFTNRCSPIRARVAYWASWLLPFVQHLPAVSSRERLGSRGCPQSPERSQPVPCDLVSLLDDSPGGLVFGIRRTTPCSRPARVCRRHSWLTHNGRMVRVLLNSAITPAWGTLRSAPDRLPRLPSPPKVSPGSPAPAAKERVCLGSRTYCEPHLARSTVIRSFSRPAWQS
jgi:hypothetical protein